MEDKEKMIIMEDDTLATAKAASATECTGLIQTPPKDEFEYESYHDVYDFLLPFPAAVPEDEISKIPSDAKKEKKTHEKNSDDNNPLII